MTDADGRVMFANAAARNMLAGEADLGQSLLALLPDLRDTLSKLDFLPPSTAGQRLVKSLAIEVTAGQQSRHLELDLSYLLNDSGRPKGLLVLLKEVTNSVRDKNALRDQNSRLEAIISGTRAGTWEWNLQTGKLYINERWAQMLGLTLAELSPISPDTFRYLTHPDDYRASEQKLQQHLDGTRPYYAHICRMRHKDGHWVWVHDRGQVTSFSEDGKPLWLTGTHIDISETKEAEERLNKLAQNIPGMIYQFAMDRQGNHWFVYVSEGIREIYQLSPEQAADNIDLVFNKIHPDDIEDVNESLLVSAGSLSQWHCQYRVSQGDNIKWLEGSATPEKLEDGTILWHGILTDITERKALEEQLRILSVTDELTGLYNRRHMLQCIKETLGQYHRFGTPFSVLMLDVDHFKNINDSHGHQVGDQVLCDLAALFSQQLRHIDKAGRLGGEEFLLLLPGTELEGAVKVAQLLCQRFREHRFHSGQQQTFNATLSVGVTSVLPSDIDVATLIKRADQAVYQAKGQGRNQVCQAD